jgi:hypothetical protein
MAEIRAVLLFFLLKCDYCFETCCIYNQSWLEVVNFPRRLDAVYVLLKCANMLIARIFLSFCAKKMNHFGILVINTGLPISFHG